MFGSKRNKKLVSSERTVSRVGSERGRNKETIGETKVNEAESSRVRIEKRLKKERIDPEDGPL